MALGEIDTVYRWKIDNFSNQISDLDYDEGRCSEYFSLNDKSGAKFVATLRGDGKVGLVCTDFGRNQTMDLSVLSWFENSDGKIYDNAKSVNYFTFDEFNTQHQCESEPSYVMQEFAGSEALFICIEIEHKAPTKGERNVNDEKELTGRSEFGQKMFALHSEGHYDLTIQVEDKEFKASKLVLMSYSEVFHRMLSCPNSIEAKTGIIKIVDTKSAVIEAMLKWIYQVEIDKFGGSYNMNQVAIDLYRVADKYEIGLLKKECVKVMIRYLSKENVPSRLILAYKSNEEHLKKRVIEFLNKCNKNLKRLMASDKWIELAGKDPELRKKILDDIFG